MTSKEALHTLKINNVDNKIVIDMLNVIEKDLEILRLLVKNIDIRYYTIYPKEIETITVFIPEKHPDYKKVKEWLEHETKSLSQKRVL